MSKEIGVGAKTDDGVDDDVKVTVKELTVSTSVGGKVQIVQYQNSQDYHYSISQKWDVQGIESDEDLWDLRQEKIEELRGHLEEVAQREMDDLIAQRDAHRES